MRICATLISVGLCLASPVLAVTHLKLADDAPPIALKDVAGKEVTLKQLRGRVVISVFGEMYHEKTREACEELEKMLGEQRLRDHGIIPLLITAQEGDDAELKLDAARKAGSFTVLRDPGRQAFGTYQVAAMPSVVVIDKEGRIVAAVAGMIPDFRDIIYDALLYGTGQISAEQFRQTLNPSTQPAAASASETAVKAQRTASLARQLARRGLDEMAAAKYAEALQLDPYLISAQEDLGLLLLKQGRLAEAEKQLRTVLKERPASLQASLALAFIQTSRGGAELNVAETSVRGILAQQPSQPRAHYLLGIIMQQRGKNDEAMVSYRKAAELLLERSPEEHE